MADRSNITQWRDSRRKRFEAASIGVLGAPTIGLLGRTWRWRVAGRDHLEALSRVSRPYILAIWHGRILPATVFFQRRGMVVMISENFDGEWIARIVSRFGYRAARGSTSHGGARALVQLRRELAQGHPAAFTVDGPRGPALRVQPGCIWLAKATGHPILPFHAEARTCWTMRSWDRTQIPKPFTTVGLCISEPYFVPPEADDEGVERHRVALEQVLLELMPRAASLAKGTQSAASP
jgi:lysophospholipid acyltransferase (LPLAT)-like uncharacterized protein